MNSVTNRRLAEGYIEELAALNAGLASVVEQVVSSVAGDLSEEEFSAWLNASRQLSRDLSDAPAVSINYLRSSKEILGLSGPATLTRCADIALELAHRSPEIATSFLQAAPSFLSHGLSSNLKDWADMGSRMCTDSWKSVSLAKTFFALSHSILESTSLASFRVL